MTYNITMKIIALFTVLIVSALSGCLDEPLTSKVDSPIMESTIIDSECVTQTPILVSTPTPEPTIIATPVSTPIPKPTIVPTPITKPTIIPTIISTPIVIKNSAIVRDSYVSQMGNFYDDIFTIIIPHEQYHDIEKEAKMAADYPGITFQKQYGYRTHPDIISYNVYINDELRGSYPPPQLEDFNCNGSTVGIYPRVTTDDYPMDIIIETEYIDGEIFKTTINNRISQGERPYGGGKRIPEECEWI